MMDWNEYLDSCEREMDTIRREDEALYGYESDWSGAEPMEVDDTPECPVTLLPGQHYIRGMGIDRIVSEYDYGPILATMVEGESFESWSANEYGEIEYRLWQ